MSDVKLVVVGEGAVGKSSLTIQFIQGFFVDYYDPTIEDSYRKQISVDDEVSLLQVLDTAGQDNFVSMRDSWLRAGECFMVVFSLSSRQSLEEALRLYEQILRIKDAERGEVPVVLLGNKADLVEERQVSEEEAKAKASEMNCVYIEASAKEGRNVEEGFYATVREHRAWRARQTCAPDRRDPPAWIRQFKAVHCSIL